LARWRNFPPPLSPSARAGAWADGSRHLAALGLLCLSCTSGQIGGEVGYGGDATLESLGSCDVVEEVPIDASEPDLPVDLASIIEALDGLEVTETMAWGSEVPASQTLRPESGSGSITVEIRYVEGSARQLEREVSDDAGPLEAAGLGGATTDSALDECLPLLAFDAEISVRTDNGALDDTFETMFVARSAYLATAAFVLEPGKFTGELELDVDGDTRDDFSGGRFELAWADGQLSGRLSGGGSTSGDESVSSEFGLLRFPAGGCTEGHDLPASSTLVASAEDAVSGLEVFALTWPTADTTELSLTHELGHACLMPWGTTTMVVVPTTSQVESTDGGVDGVWDLEGTLSFDEQGEMTGIELGRSEFWAWEPADFAASTGITGIAVGTEWPATFSFQLSDVVGDEFSAQGTLTVLESHPIPCDTAPDAPSDGGGVAPGCAGDELVEIGTATLIQAD